MRYARMGVLAGALLVLEACAASPLTVVPRPNLVTMRGGLVPADTPVTTRIDIARQTDLGIEGYELTIDSGSITLVAASDAGIFYGGQTLRQMTMSANRLPAMVITDTPRFAIRGVLVDPVRHFIPVAELEKLIDAFAFHKLNTLHLHLTDDQGWRVPIEPTDAELAAVNATLGANEPLRREEFDRLITIGSKRRATMIGRAYTRFDGEVRDDGVPHEGSYSRAEIDALVAYAHARHMKIIPEIEMPGHMGAAIAANPALGNHPERQLEVNPRWGVHDATLRPTERNIAFMQMVLTKVMQMFPDAPYIHIGGDEAPVTEWVETNAVANKREELRQSGRLAEALRSGPLDDAHDLQAYLVRAMVRHVAAHGHIAGAWDEVLDASPPPRDVAIWSWRDVRRGVDAAAAGHDVLLLPADRVYLDRPPTDDPDEPIGQPYVLTAEQVYRFDHDPDPDPPTLSPRAAAKVRGAIATLWSEHAYDAAILEYFAFTRLPAFAEAAWTSRAITQTDAGYADFERRMVVHRERLDALGLRHTRPVAPVRVRDLPN